MKLINLSTDERRTAESSGFYYSGSGDFNTPFDLSWIERQSLFQTVVAEAPDYINTPRLFLGIRCKRWSRGKVRPIVWCFDRRESQFQN